MCKHVPIKFNDVYVCVKCGLTLTFDGKVVFDRRLPVRVRAKAQKRRRKKK